MPVKWFRPGHFIPRDILSVPAYHNLTKTGKRVYEAFCKHSYLTKKQYKRRYVCLTKNQIAEEIGCSSRTVQREIQKMLKSRLILRWFDGNSGPAGCVSAYGEYPTRSVGCDLARATPPRYELPASNKQITYWRIRYSKKGGGRKK